MTKANPIYYRLKNDDNDVVGTQRVVTEYHENGSDRWQLEPIPHDRDATMRLDSPPFGIAGLKRPLLGKKKKEDKDNAKT